MSISKEQIIWKGRPWIVPSIVNRTILVIIVGVVLTLIEIQLGVSGFVILGFQTIFWAILLLSLVWLIWVVGLYLSNRFNLYILRQNSLEVTTGIGSQKSVVVSATGFSDLELTRSITNRIFNVGEITVTTDSGLKVRLKGVRDSVKIAGLIRDVMTKPVVRVE